MLCPRERGEATTSVKVVKPPTTMREGRRASSGVLAAPGRIDNGSLARLCLLKSVVLDQPTDLPSVFHFLLLSLRSLLLPLLTFCVCLEKAMRSLSALATGAPGFLRLALV